jgi:DNA topoisomerase-1
MNEEAKQTQPPPRYSEAGLIKELEKRGIGRPSTYASTIKTIQDREYVEKEGRALKPTELGMVVNDFLDTNFTSYISDDFTSQMEDDLDKIAAGKREYEKILKDFYKPFLKEVKSKDNVPKINDLGPAPAEYPCPKCGSAMVYKLGRSGKFISCSRFPDCDGARSENGQEMQGKTETGESCPECGKPLIERDGKFGRFIACSKYPKCKYVKRDEAAALAQSTGVKCPTCGEKDGGELVPKRGKFGEFYGCSNYPKCRFTIKAKPTGDKCSMCHSLMMAGTKTIPVRCSNKDCPNHNPHKLGKDKK